MAWRTCSFLMASSALTHGMLCVSMYLRSVSKLGTSNATYAISTHPKMVTTHQEWNEGSAVNKYLPYERAAIDVELFKRLGCDEFALCSLEDILPPNKAMNNAKDEEDTRKSTYQ